MNGVCFLVVAERLSLVPSERKQPMPQFDSTTWAGRAFTFTKILRGFRMLPST